MLHSHKGGGGVPSYDFFYKKNKKRCMPENIAEYIYPISQQHITRHQRNQTEIRLPISISDFAFVNKTEIYTFALVIMHITYNFDIQ